MRVLLDVLARVAVVGTALARFLLRHALSFLVVLALLAFNVAALTVPAVFRAASAVVEAVRPGATVAGRHEAEVEGERRRTAVAREEAIEATAGLRRVEVERDRALAARREAEEAAARLGRRLDAANDARARLMDSHRAAMEAVDDERRRVASRIDEVSARVLRRAARGAVRAPSVLLASSIPLAGRGIDLAGTVLDLQDACAMATDLAGLREDADLSVLGEAVQVCGAVDLLPSLDDLASPPSQDDCTRLIRDVGLAPEVCAPPQGPSMADPAGALPPPPPAPYQAD